MYNSVSDFKDRFVKVNRDSVFNKNCIEDIKTLWMGDCCKYLSNTIPNCSSELNGALNQGANQIIAYLNRKYDFLINE